jgi:hypothetical protein
MGNIKRPADNGRTNKTGFKGVREVRPNCYQAVITLRINGEQVQKIIGSAFKTAPEAYVARVEYIKSLI